MYMDMYIYEYVNIRIYFYICNYWCLWICMYMDMYMYMIPFAEHWSVRYTARSHSWSLKFAFRHNFARSTHRILREGSSSRMKMCVSLQRRACKSMEMLSFATVACAKCMRYGGRGGDPYHGGGGWQHGTRNHIYIYNCWIRSFYILKKDEKGKAAPDGQEQPSHLSRSHLPFPLRKSSIESRSLLEKLWSSPQSPKVRFGRVAIAKHKVYEKGFMFVLCFRFDILT